MSKLILLPSLVLTVLLLLVSATSAKTDEWVQECKGDECGYSARQRGRADCDDHNSNCRSYALGGECLANPVWMTANCERSCGLCASQEIEDDVDCKDLHVGCPKWAGELECFVNPLYMSRACPKSCALCVNATELREEGVSEEKIEHIWRFSRTDFGLWQTISDTNREKVTRVIMDMGLYAHNLQTIGPGRLCNNGRHDCAELVVENGGCENDLNFMLSECSLACHYCDVIEEYHRCRNARPELDPVPFGQLQNIQLHLFHEKDAQNLLDGYNENLEAGEWIFALKYKDIWTNDETQLQMLRELRRAVKSEIGPLQWTEATEESFKDFPVEDRPKRSGRVATCAKACQMEEPTFGLLAKSIAALLQVDEKYLQALEFVHYKRGERFSAHHDFRIHDQWKHSGSRVLTVFVSLEKPPRGGSFGFPEYDWLLVNEPEVLVWPNVPPRSPGVGLRRMKSEQLPVVDGEMYGVYVALRQYPYDSENACT